MPGKGPIFPYQRGKRKKRNKWQDMVAHMRTRDAVDKSLDKTFGQAFKSPWVDLRG
jgi:hypothetical protein